MIKRNEIEVMLKTYVYKYYYVTNQKINIYCSLILFFEKFFIWGKQQFNQKSITDKNYVDKSDNSYKNE